MLNTTHVANILGEWIAIDSTSDRVINDIIIYWPDDYDLLDGETIQFSNLDEMRDYEAVIVGALDDNRKLFLISNVVEVFCPSVPPEPELSCGNWKEDGF